MNIINQLHPTDPAQQKEMMAKGPDGPIYMINLLKYKKRAEYADGRETNLSGREAYNIYAKEILKLIPRHGGKITFRGDVTFLAIGQADEIWDEVAIAEFPNRSALLKVSTSEAWRAISIHRAAGLEGQLNIETVSPLQKNQ